jgi:hypothetical protein
MRESKERQEKSTGLKTSHYAGVQSYRWREPV